MVTVTAGNAFGLNMADLNFSRLYGGSDYNASSKAFVIIYESGFVDTFRGKGFDYNRDGEPISGSVTSFAEHFGAEAIFEVRGLNASAKAIGNAAGTATLKDDYKIIFQALDGNDTVRGGAMGDVLFGYDGNDRLIGQGGPDVLFGGAGADRFIFTSFSQAAANPDALDHIGDFSQKDRDKIDLSGVAGGLQFGVSVAALSDGKTTIVGVDVQGDGTLEMAIEFAGVINFRASDFIL